MKKFLGLFFSKENKDNIFRLWKISLRHKWLLIFAFISLLITASLSLYLPMQLKGFIQIFSSNDMSEAFSSNVTSYFFIFVINSIFASLHHTLIRLFTMNFIKSMREYYVKILLEKDIEFFDQNKTSDLFSLLTEDIQNLTDSSILELFSFFQTVSKGIGAIILMFYFFFKLSCILIVIFPFVVYFARKRHKQAMKERKNIREQRHSSHNIVLESLENIKTVKAFSTEEKELKKYEIQLEKMMREQFNLLLKTTILRNIFVIVFIALILLIIKYGLYLATKLGESEENYTKNLFPFVLYCGMLVGSFNDIANRFDKIQKSLVISEKLFKIIDYIPSIKNAPTNEYSFATIKGDIEFKNINFSYPTKKDVEVLNNFNLKIKPGMRLGIVGASGSGKSTIISLLQRLYNCGKSQSEENIKNYKNNDNKSKIDDYIELPNINNESLLDSESEILTGESDASINMNTNVSLNNKQNEDNSSILIDNINIKLFDIKYYHNQIGYVCQEPPLFNTTILENILYGTKEDPQHYDKNEIEKILKMSKADFVFDESLFPKGLETMVGEKGSQLSGGQKQRIAIARALIKKPKLLILDEATSALDAESEYEIQNQIYNLSKDMNIIIVAHRLSSIKNCDEIIVIDHGKIVEKGNHQELINLNGKYKELMEKQLHNSFE